MKWLVRAIGDVVAGTVMITAVAGACPCQDLAALLLPQGCCQAGVSLDPAAAGCCANVPGARLTTAAACRRASERVVAMTPVTWAAAARPMAGVLGPSLLPEVRSVSGRLALPPNVPAAVLRI